MTKTRKTSAVAAARDARREVNRLRGIIFELLDCYWGEGDGAPPPNFIARAQREVGRLTPEDLSGVDLDARTLARLEMALARRVEAALSRVRS